MSLAKKNMREADHRRRDVAFAFGSLGVSVVVGIYFAKALWAVPFVGIAVYFSCDYGLSFIRKKIYGAVIVNCLVAVLVTYATWSFYLRDEYHKQMAAETEGDLEPIPSDGTDGVTLQIGSDGPQFVRNVTGNIGEIIMPLESLKIAYDAGLLITRGPKGLELTTPVIDGQGNRVGEIVSNHWKVYPPYCSDKNYNKHSIEIRDRTGHVVLQVTLYRNKIQLQGEWHTSLGQGERLESVPGLGGITFWLKPEDEKKFPFLIKPMFVYPSSHHWGELVSMPQ
jgi:hypothetical protein